MKLCLTRKSNPPIQQASSDYLMIMKMKIAFVKDENGKAGKKMKLNSWFCLGGDPKKVANECDENIFVRYLKSQKYNELSSLPEKERVEYPGYSSSNHYQNVPSNPFTVPCCPNRVPCNMSPKFVSKNNHRAADVTGCSGDADAYDQPPPHSKQRLHHPQRVRKHSTNSSTISNTGLSHKNHSSCHYVNCDHNRSKVPATEHLSKMELTAPSSVSCVEGISHLLPAPCNLTVDQLDKNCAKSAGSCASTVACRTGTSSSPIDDRAAFDICRTDDWASGATHATDICASLPDSGVNAVTCRTVNWASSSPLSLLIPPPASVYTLSKADQRLSESFYSSEDDLRIITESQQLLRLSGWYHPRLSWPQASEILMHAPVGTFLLRNSSDINHLYSLSVQTKCGPTSIRIHYAKGWFRMAGSGEEAKQLPKFPCIMQLVQHYADRTKKLPMPCTPDENHNWQNVGGPPTTTPIVLRKPKYTDGQVPSLKHLSRLCINRNIKDSSFLPMLQAPSFIINYLTEYPFKL